MSNLLFVVGGAFVILWFIGFRGYYPMGGHINILLFMAFIAAVMGFIERRPTLKRKVKEDNSSMLS